MVPLRALSGTLTYKALPRPLFVNLELVQKHILLASFLDIWVPLVMRLCGLAIVRG